jgi:hypothetical protein
MLAVEFPFAPYSRLPESGELFENPVEDCPHGCPAIARTLTGNLCELPTPPEQFNSPLHARRRPSNWLIYTCKREQSKGNECKRQGAVQSPACPRHKTLQYNPQRHAARRRLWQAKTWGN